MLKEKINLKNNRHSALDAKSIYNKVFYKYIRNHSDSECLK